MKIDDWLQWPTRSTDPALNAAIAVLLAMALFIALAMGALVVIPVIVVIGIAKAVHWYTNRPTPTDQLYLQAQQRVIAANFPSPDQFTEAFAPRLAEAVRSDPPAYDIWARMAMIAEALYEQERLNNPLPPIAPSGSIEEGRYRDELIAYGKKTQDAPHTLEVIHTALSKAFMGFLETLPPLAHVPLDVFVQTDEAHAPSALTLIDTLPDAGKSVLALILPFFSEQATELGLFTSLRRQLDANYARSGPKAPVSPDEYDGSPQELVSTYLADTLLESLFAASVPFAFTDAQRYEHMHVIGGSGHGKTQLLQHLIYNDLTRPEPPALIVIDSQGEMLRKIERLDLFARAPLQDRLVIIDPEDVEYPPALNMFDMANARLASYSALHREQIEAAIIELYNYIFGALAAELTQKQGTAFAYVTRLMLAVPGATIQTLRELMEDSATSVEASPFRDAIATLDTTSQAFFQNQFFSKAFVQTRQQIARRLYGVLQVPAFDRMFSSKTNKLDMFEAIQSGKIVLVNTSRALLKTDASALFGRYMIALAIRAAFERVAATTRAPAFLIVDEAAEYFDENLETLLSQARKFNLGVLFAHQHLDQLSPALRASVAANTSIKLAGGVSDRDARALAPDMRTTAEFITSCRKKPYSTEFACYVRNVTAHAMRLEIPFGTVEQASRMSSGAFSALIARNRALYAVDREQPRRAAAGPDTHRMAAPPDIPLKERDDDWRS